MKKSEIFVTQPSLPSIDDLFNLLNKTWKSKILTNNGPFHNELENELCKYLEVPYISLVSNATIGLVLALKVLDIRGEVITTPYSFLASANSLLWNQNKPVFVDIDQYSLNIDPKKIEPAITEKTSAIMPVHVYGYPCDVDAIAEIANKYNLKVIYDAAHAFGVKCHSGSLLKHGDLSVLSFHATKVFNTFEGGAIITNNKDTKAQIDQLKNFGLAGETSAEIPGINGKMSEFNSALGLLQLKKIETYIQQRKDIDEFYRQQLKNVPGIRCHIKPKSEKHNYNYFPVFVEDRYPLSRDQLYKKLKKKRINARRYFYPLITDFSAYKNTEKIFFHDLSIAKIVSEKILCLPIYPELSFEKIKLISNVLKY